MADEGLGSGAVLAVLAGHEADLMRRANVVAVAPGTVDGAPCITVYVTGKVPAEQLAPADLLPREVDGVRVQVLESGPIGAQG
ncbi:hypothetical protein [Intrasporangium sp.]|uniref:hypothetical protein n=1 Tax=Intrasporangium sp. TaxID=1925024 RepID=UPI003221F072